jgi:two-component system chemotaxis response regulator CheY
MASRQYSKAMTCLQKNRKGITAMDLLLVDDSNTMRLLIHRAIRQAGYRDLMVCEAENGVVALDKVKSEKPRLIISDWLMPEVSGMELLQKLRDSGDRTPFGFITSQASQRLEDFALSHGASFMIVKPFNVDEIQAALDPILGGS